MHPWGTRSLRERKRGSAFFWLVTLLMAGRTMTREAEGALVAVVELESPLRSLEELSWQNGEGALCGSGGVCDPGAQEVCVATVKADGGPYDEACLRDSHFSSVCRALSCKAGTTCRVRVDWRAHHVVHHVGCVYRSEELDRFAAEHNSTGSAAAHEEEVSRRLVPAEDDTPVAWCIVISVLSLLPLIVLAAIVVYRFVYKLPRMGREKEELSRLFQTLGYDENTEIYKKVMDWMYGHTQR